MPLSRVKINSLSNLSRVILGLPLSLFLTYFVLKKLSLTDYGSWALILSFFSYFSFVDLGMTTAVTRYISRFKAENKIIAINQTLNTALIFYICIGFFLTLILFIFQDPLLNLFFKNSRPLYIEQIYLLVILMGYIDFVFSTFLSLLNSFQRMEITSLVDLLKTILYTIFGYLLLSYQAILLNLSIAFVITTILWALIAFLMARIIFREMKLSLFHFNQILLRKMLKFGLQTHFSSLTVLLHFNLDKFLVGHFLGVDKVTFLDIALKLINQSRLLVSSFISPLLPAATEKGVLFKDKLMVFYQRSFRYVMLFAAFVFGGLILISPLFIRLWLGPGFSLAVTATQLLAIGHFVNLLTGPAGSIILGQGNPRPILYFSLFEALINILLSYFGVIYFGFIGAITGTLMSLFIPGVVFIYLAPRYFKNEN